MARQLDNYSYGKHISSCRGKRMCGNCIYNQRDDYTGEYTCGNEESEAYGCEVCYTDVCSEHEYLE